MQLELKELKIEWLHDKIRRPFQDRLADFLGIRLIGVENDNCLFAPRRLAHTPDEIAGRHAFRACGHHHNIG